MKSDKELQENDKCSCQSTVSERRNDEEKALTEGIRHVFFLTSGSEREKYYREVNKYFVFMYKGPPYLKVQGKVLMQLREHLWSTHYIVSTILYRFILCNPHNPELLFYDSETGSERVKYCQVSNKVKI